MDLEVNINFIRIILSGYPADDFSVTYYFQVFKAIVNESAPCMNSLQPVTISIFFLYFGVETLISGNFCKTGII
jgi:hypothetical protein